MKVMNRNGSLWLEQWLSSRAWQGGSGRGQTPEELKGCHRESGCVTIIQQVSFTYPKLV